MQPPTRIISADYHVIEHPRVWIDRLSRQRWDDRIPHVERDVDGLDYWLIDGCRGGRAFGVISVGRGRWWRDVRSDRRERAGARLRACIQRLANRGMGGGQLAFRSAVYRADVFGCGRR